MNSTSTEIKVSEIKPYANNPRKNEKAIDKVADSIREFGFTQPVVLDRDFVLIIGHTRFEAAKRLGMETIPAILRPDLKPEQVTALRIADNKLGELADWDFEKLEIEIQALQERGFDFEITGFTVEEFERTRAQRIKEGLRDADEPETEPTEPVTVEPGDLFTMGTHRLLCGDAGDPAQIERLFDGRRADMIITDPPYNVAAKFSKGGRTRRFGYKPRNSAVGRPERKGKDIRQKQILNDDLTPAQYAERLNGWIKNIADRMNDGAVYYLFGAKANLMNYPRAIESAGLHFHTLLVWQKLAPIISRGDFMNDIELIYYGWKKGKEHPFYGAFNITDVWKAEQKTWINELSDGSKILILDETVEIPSRLWKVKGESKATRIHLTQKPVELFRRAISYSSREGEIIFDPFAGSGTAIIAGEQTARRVYAMDLEPEYVQRIVKRWESFSGQTATVEKGGK